MKPAGHSRGVWTAALFACASFGHLIYPALLHGRTRRLRDPRPPELTVWPEISVVIPAFRERAVIRAKVANVLENGYPGPIEVIVVAEDEGTASAARETPAKVVSPGGRLGKAGAVNVGVAAASASLIVLTDANNTLNPGALQHVVRWFADPGVGAVTGEKRVDGGAEAAYWLFEGWLKRREARTGSTVGLVGELAAVRREVFRELPTGLVLDDLWLALDVLEQRRRIAYEPRAVAREPAGARAGDEWERRTRNISGLLELFRVRWRVLLPGTTDVTVQLWGHRFVRGSIGPLAHVALLVRSLRRAPRSIAWAAFALGHVAAAVALVRRLRGQENPRVLAVLAQILFLQGVALGGLVRFVGGERLAHWPKPERRDGPRRAGDRRSHPA